MLGVGADPGRVPPVRVAAADAARVGASTWTECGEDIDVAVVVLRLSVDRDATEE